MDKLAYFETRYDFADYKTIFSLSEKDLQDSILEIPDYYSSFNSELTEIGGRVVSCSSLFNLLESEVTETLTIDIKNNIDDFAKKNANTPEIVNAFVKKNEKILVKFLNSYKKDVNKTNYIGCDILELPFTEGQFILALCCNNLFGANIDSNFNRDLSLIKELLRVSNQVRIFPLNDKKFVTCKEI